MKAGWESLVKEAAKIIYKFHSKIKNADQVSYYSCSANLENVTRMHFTCEC